MGAYLNWRDQQLINPDPPLSQERLDDPDDHNPFGDDYRDCAVAGYEACIKRGDGLVEYGYVSILLFLGMDEGELQQWRMSLINALSTKMRTKFEANRQAYVSSVERKAQRAADKQNRKRNVKDAQTFDPLASNNSGEMQTKKKPTKKLNKPKTGAKGSARRYANEIGKSNTKSMFDESK